MDYRQSFRVAIIGTGRIAQVMTDAIRNTRDVEIVAVASRSGERSEQFAKKNRIPKSYPSYESLICSEGYDIIYVSTVNTTHFEIAKECLLAGKPVLVEKPLCTSYNQVQELIGLSKRNSTFLAEAMPLRYSENMRIAKDIIGNGEIGSVHLLTANIGIDSWETERIRKKSMGGGALNDLGIYGITISDMIFSGEKPIVKAEQNEDDGVDAQSSIILSYNAAQSVLFNSVKLQTKGCSVIYGDKGRIIINKAYNADKVIKFAGFRNIKVYRTSVNRYIAEVRACADALSKGLIETEEYRHDDILRTYALMEKVRGNWAGKY